MSVEVRGCTGAACREAAWKKRIRNRPKAFDEVKEICRQCILWSHQDLRLGRSNRSLRQRSNGRLEKKKLRYSRAKYPNRDDFSREMTHQQSPRQVMGKHWVQLH